MRTKLLSLSLSLGFCTAAFVGCESRQAPNPPAPAVQPPAGSSAATPDGTPPAKDPAAPAVNQVAPPAPAAATVPVSTETEEIMLGSDELTAGIPGDGELTTEQIKKWLDDPKNHRVIKPLLPVGMDVGTEQIKGLKDNPLTRAKIELGRQLYFDPRLSSDNTISCASCHAPDFGYAKNTQFGEGIKGKDGKAQLGGRNSPVAYNRILSDLQFWDGRAKSLEDQATGPIQNPIEMGNTHEACVGTVKELAGYRLQFEKVFGEITIENIGKAIASFERALVTGASPYDYNEQLRSITDPDEDLNPDQLKIVTTARAELKKTPMSEAAKKGRELFFGKANCTACHNGPNFSDELYHNLGIGMDVKEPDLGRYAIIKDLAMDVKEKDKLKGAFKTPTIRNISATGPYMHDGSLKTLEEVIDWYVKGGHPNPNLDEKMKKLEINAEERDQLVAFMKSTEGKLPKVNPGRLPNGDKVSK